MSILEHKKLKHSLSSKELKELGIKHGSLALKIIEDTELAEKLNDNQREAEGKCTNLWAQLSGAIIGAFEGALIGGVKAFFGLTIAGVFNTLRYVSYIKNYAVAEKMPAAKVKKKLVAARVAESIAINFLLVLFAVVVGPFIAPFSIFYNMYRGASFYWNRGVSKVGRFAVLSTVKESKRAFNCSLFKAFALAFGFSSKKYHFPEVTVKLQAERYRQRADGKD